MPGRVEEDDATAVVLDLARTDVLGDATRLTRCHFGTAHGVEQARLAVVDVTHDRHDGRAGHQVGRRILAEQDWLAGALFLGAGRHDLLGRGHLRRRPVGCAAFDGFEPKLAGHQRGRVEIDRLVDGGEDAVADQLLDDVRMAHVEGLGEVLDGDRRRQLHGPRRARGNSRGGLDGGRHGRLASLRTRWAAWQVSTGWHGSPLARALPA